MATISEKQQTSKKIEDSREIAPAVHFRRMRHATLK